MIKYMSRPALDRVSPEESLVFIGFNVVESMAESLKRLEAASQLNRSELIRAALSEYLTTHQEVAA